MGLLAILLTAALIAWWAIYYSPLAHMDAKTDPEKSAGFQAIDDAKDIKDLLETRSENLGL
jgi:hypothetical protein